MKTVKGEVELNIVCSDQPIWCVYGYKDFPSIMCCIIKDSGDLIPSPVIWGYSVYKRVPGFRTIGDYVVNWRKNKDIVKFFVDKQDALNFIGECVTPKVKK